ncbi:dendrin [Lacerta agilis]|uniref:dendrin n=1 Tax=Lacerta agilis TaxID=80427 RepID=UPI001419922F|nr:dendrin [Lacerta agilis]
MFERPGLSPGDTRRLHVCERTNLLLVEFNRVSCSSRDAMEAELWTGRGYSAPWMYHSVAGQYTLLDKQLVSDFSPARRGLGARVLQDSTNWHDAQLFPPRWGPRRPEGHWFSGKDPSKAAPSPKAQRQPNPPYDGLPPMCRRDVSSNAARGPAEGCKWSRRGAPKSKGELPARAPPSYEAHMLLRLRAGPGPRKENWPRPPPYIAPPSYEAPHRTVQPKQRASKEASTAKQSQAEAPKKSREGTKRACESGPAAGRKAGRSPSKLPGSWSYLSGATTWGGGFGAQPERAGSRYPLGSCLDASPQHRGHTLPRATKRGEPGRPHPGSPLQHTLPAGWGFSHAAGRPEAAVGGESKAAGEQLRCRFPKWKEPGGSHAAASHRSTPRRRGGLFVIDATCVVIQAHYIPPPRTERVRYLGREETGAAPPPGSPAPASMEERAARILGLPVSELGFAGAGGGEASGSGSPARGAAGSCASDAAPFGDAPAVGQPAGPPSAPASPAKPLAPPAPDGSQAGPTELAGPACPSPRGAAAPGQEGGCPPRGGKEAGAKPALPSPSRSYVRDLKEAMSRIRRHTAPDSDTDEELEQEWPPASGRAAWKGRLGEGALSYSSSSSLDSSCSNATVVPGSAPPGLRNGPESGWELQAVGGRGLGRAEAGPQP